MLAFLTRKRSASEAKEGSENAKPAKIPKTEHKSQQPPEIKGLYLCHDFISQAEHDDLLKELCALPYSTQLKREVQQYGFEYNYAASSKRPQTTTPIPDFLKFLLDRLMEQKHFDKMPDQIIVNKYLPGEGIGNHTDHKLHFGPIVASLTLRSHCVMEMTKYQPSPLSHLRHPILLEPRSLLVLKDEARYDWLHGIEKIKQDKLESGKILKRGTRISITFRNMKQS